jgi:hypothetical protein
MTKNQTVWSHSINTTELTSQLENFNVTCIDPLIGILIVSVNIYLFLIILILAGGFIELIRQHRSNSTPSYSREIIYKNDILLSQFSRDPSSKPEGNLGTFSI